MVLWLPCPCGLMGFIWVSICITPPLIDGTLFPTSQKCWITLLSFSNIVFLPFSLFWWMLCPLYRLQIILFCILLAFFTLSHFWERSIFIWVYMHVWGGMCTLGCSCLQRQKRGYWMSYLQRHMQLWISLHDMDIGTQALVLYRSSVFLNWRAIYPDIHYMFLWYLLIQCNFLIELFLLKSINFYSLWKNGNFLSKL